MGSATIDPHSQKKKAGVGQPKYCNNANVHVVLTNLCSILSCQKEHTEIHKIPKFGVNRASFD